MIDPFGGSGVTLIESLVLDRRGIHVDLNPLSIFIVATLLERVDYVRLERDFEAVCKAFKEKRPRTRAEIDGALRKYQYPRGIALPQSSDVLMSR